MKKLQKNFSINRSEVNGQIVLKFAGKMDEKSNFSEIEIPDQAQTIVFNFKEITRINSLGVKAWIEYIATLSEKNINVFFQECPEIFVEQLNMLPTFLGGAEITSVYAPYECNTCLITTHSLVDITPEIKSGNVPDKNCEKCGNPMQFADLPEAYFEFLHHEEPA